MKVAEIYQSIQGEGFLTGTTSVFVRTSGCNLRCRYCDTPYASWHPEGDDLSVAEILEQIDAWDCANVVLTGGEPMLFAELVPVCEGLRRRGQHITIETAGTLFLPLECDLMSISPKLSNSTPAANETAKWRGRHERSRQAPAVIRQLVSEYPYQLKFVVGTPTDADEVQTYLEYFPEIERQRVMLMPQGTDVDTLDRVRQWLRPYCQQNELQFCPRRQIEWFGLVRGT